MPACQGSALLRSDSWTLLKVSGSGIQDSNPSGLMLPLGLASMQRVGSASLGSKESGCDGESGIWTRIEAA